MNREEENRGSQWHKWDFHVHTPYSILNNQFPCNNQFPWTPYSQDEPAFDGYVRTLFTKAVQANVSAIGITDYFSVDGYKRIRAEYLDKPDKLEALFPDAALRERVKSIYVFPNVELRLSVFVGDKSHSVNYHVIFSGEVSAEEIEKNFLERLTIKENGKPLTEMNVKAFGREYAENEDTPYKIGMEKITVDDKEICDLLKSNFPNQYVITVPVDEDLSKISWNGRDAPTRKRLYRQCDCLLTSNEKTRNWALAKGKTEAEQKDILSKLGALKPCIWGSDAHNDKRMFAPDGNRHCWIKAELSFAGLRQILEEPEDRVRIQSDSPAPNRPHQTIDYIRFSDNSFPPEPIYFSDGLTCIIGGKSTGKSVLLRHIADGISPSTVRDRESELKEDPEKKLKVDAEVVWKDGESGERKIIYIPQSLLNRLADNKVPGSSINKLIEDTLLQNEDIKRAYEQLQSDVSRIIEQAKHNILNYIGWSDSFRAHDKALIEDGRASMFQARIEQMTEQRQSLTELAGMTPELMERYTALDAQMQVLSAKIDSTNKEAHAMSLLQEPFVYVPSVSNPPVTVVWSNGTHSYDFNSMPMAKARFEDGVRKMNDAIRAIWGTVRQEMQAEYNQRIFMLTEQQRNLQSELAPLKSKVSFNAQLQEIERVLQEEQKNFNAAQERERLRDEASRQAEAWKGAILRSRQELADAYMTFTESVRNINVPDTYLIFGAEVGTKTQPLWETINTLFDNRGFRPFQSKYSYDLSSAEDLRIDDQLFEKLWQAMVSGELSLKGGNTIQTALENLFRDWNYVRYTVQRENDPIGQMSKGKKALVLLEMLIHLEKGHCPILIDQPEDDLDNRSIYSELVQYLKEKKRERQIIVVTHNANVVVGADAEEVIIANQNGKDAPNYQYQFEYRSGAIENNRPVMENGTVKAGVLYQKGIQEQICDILEGGRQAFEKRRSRYWGTKQRE